MGLFNKLFGKSEQNESFEQPNIETPQNLTPCKNEAELLERFGGIAFEKQLDFGDIIGQNSWNVDMTKGEISFGENLTFPIQLLGTFSHSNETWLWAWANTKSGIPESFMQQALKLKKYGEENGIELLSVDNYDSSINDLHLIGITASGMFESSAYYIADYGQGAMVVTIQSDEIEKLKSESHQRILTVFPQLISQFDMNHKFALENYLKAKGYAVILETNKVTGEKNGQNIVGAFDEQSRLTNLDG